MEPDGTDWFLVADRSKSSPCRYSSALAPFRRIGASAPPLGILLYPGNKEKEKRRRQQQQHHGKRKPNMAELAIDDMQHEWAFIRV